MKVGITGHTKGIGRELFLTFQQNGYDVIGYSLSTGHDISTDQGIASILKDAKNLDVFINNAYEITGQEKLLKGFLKEWEGTNKYLFHLSSIITKNRPSKLSIISIPEDIKNDLIPYALAKRSMEQIINLYDGTVNLVNIVPGLVDTELSEPLKKHLDTKGIDPQILSKLIFDLFEYRNFLTIPEIVIDCTGNNNG